MPEKSNPPAAPNNDNSPLSGMLRQYLTKLTGKDSAEEVRKEKKVRKNARKNSNADGESGSGKIYMKKMRVRLNPPAANIESGSTEEVAPTLEKSLQEYITRRQAVLSRYTEGNKQNRKSPTMEDMPLPPAAAELMKIVQKVEKMQRPAKKPEEAIEKKLSTKTNAKKPPAAKAGAWSSFMQMLPFMSQKVDDTSKRTQKLEAQVQSTAKQTQDMAKRLKDAEELLKTKIASAEKPESPEAKLTAEEVAELRKDLGKLKSAAKEEVAPSEEVITKDSMGGLQKVKDTSTFGLTEKKKQGFFSSLFGAAHEAAADLREAAPGKSAKTEKIVLPALPVTSAPKTTLSEPAGKLLRKGETEQVKNASIPPVLATPEKAKEAPADTSTLGSLVSSFQGKEGTQGTPAASAKALPTADRKQEELARKQKLENEEKKAEYMMMTSAKSTKKREAGFFTQLFASVQYFGMGKERLSIVQNLATMLNAGLPLIDALRTLQMEARNGPTKKLLGRINGAVENGSPLWRAMDDQHFFSPHAIALIRIGEEAGNLAQNMEYLAAQQEKDQNLREKVKTAMIYPAIVLTLMFFVVMGLGLFVLPQLVQVLFNLNVKLPLITRLVIAFSNGFSKHGLIVVPSILGGVLFLVILGKFTRFKVVVQWVVFKIPGIGKLARQATLARFGVILGGLLEAGVPLVESMKSLVDVTPIVSYKRFYRRMLDHVTVGDSFAKCFAMIPSTNKLFPISMQQLIITGEKTGSLAKIMLKVSEIYEKEANDTAQKLPVILEPMLLLFIGALVGTIAFAIIIPIYSVVGNVSR